MSEQALETNTVNPTPFPLEAFENDKYIEAAGWNDGVLIAKWRDGPMIAYKDVNEELWKAANNFDHGVGLYIKEFIKGQKPYQKQSAFGTDAWSLPSGAETVTEQPVISEAKQNIAAGEQVANVQDSGAADETEAAQEEADATSAGLTDAAVGAEEGEASPETPAEVDAVGEETAQTETSEEQEDEKPATEAA